MGVRPAAYRLERVQLHLSETAALELLRRADGASETISATIERLLTAYP